MALWDSPAVTNAITAWQMLHRKARVRAGQTVLVHGATGGAGSVLVQLAHAAGARVGDLKDGAGGSSMSGCRGGQHGLGRQAEIPDHRIRVPLAADHDDLAGGRALDRDGEEVGTQRAAPIADR